MIDTTIKSNNFTLLTCLSTTSELLSRSTENGWSGESPNECNLIIRGIINHLFDNNAKLPLNWNIQFSATGPIQEIAISNGWGKTYLLLADLWDKNSSQL